MEMTVSGEVLYLPVPSPVQLPFTGSKLIRKSPREVKQAGRHRIYRSPPRHTHRQMIYGANGYANPQPVTGRIIDIRA
jgi:hypothetical protein